MPAVLYRPLSYARLSYRAASAAHVVAVLVRVLAEVGTDRDARPRSPRKRPQAAVAGTVVVQALKIKELNYAPSYHHCNTFEHSLAIA